MQFLSEMFGGALGDLLSRRGLSTHYPLLGVGGGYVGKKGLSRVMWSKRGEDKGTPHYTNNVFSRPLPENGGVGPCPNF